MRVLVVTAIYPRPGHTGEGGDELFAGYARYAGERFAPLVARFPVRARVFGERMSRRSLGSTRPSIALHVGRRGLFEPRAVAELLAEHDAGTDLGPALWALLSIQLWHCAFLDHAPSLSQAA
jgi:hypothetical protein